MNKHLKIKRTLNHFPLDAAEAAIANYKTILRRMNVMEQNMIKAYLVSYEDIAHTLGIDDQRDVERKFDQMRVYIGAINGLNEGDPLIFKLFLVPVDNDGFDRIPKDLDGKEFVYDFNVPCPNTCDTVSPLYKAGETV
jgi:hypothetical protein